MENLRYYWLRDENKRPIACIASRRTHTGLVEFTIACHNPIDKFSKRLGREIAAGRFIAPSQVWEVNTIDNVKLAILSAIIECGTLVPYRVEAAARYQKSIYKVRNPQFARG